MKNNCFKALCRAKNAGGYNSLSIPSKCRCVCLFAFSILLSFAAFAQTTQTDSGTEYTVTIDNHFVLTLTTAPGNYTTGQQPVFQSEVRLDNVLTLDQAAQGEYAGVTIPETFTIAYSTIDPTWSNQTQEYRVVRMTADALNGLDSVAYITFPSSLRVIERKQSQQHPIIIAPNPDADDGYPAPYYNVKHGQGFNVTFLGEVPPALGTNTYYWFLHQADSIYLPCHYSDSIHYTNHLADSLYANGTSGQYTYIFNNSYARQGFGYVQNSDGTSTPIVLGEHNIRQKIKANNRLSVIDGTTYLEGLCLSNSNHNSKVFANEVTMKEEGSLFILNLDSVKHVEDATFKVERTLKVDQWNLVGLLNDGQNYEALYNNIGNNSGTAHDVYAVPFNYSNNKWGDWAYANEQMPGKANAIMVWPTKHGIGATADLGDLTVTLVQTTSFRNNFYIDTVHTTYTTPSQALVQQYVKQYDNNSLGTNAKHWFAIANPTLSAVSATDVAHFESDIHYHVDGSVLSYSNMQQYAYFWNVEQADWQSVKILAYTHFENYSNWEDLYPYNQYLIKPGTGIMVGATPLASTVNHSKVRACWELMPMITHYKTTKLIKDYGLSATGSHMRYFLKSTQRPEDNTITFSSRTDEAVKTIYAKHNDEAEDGYDVEDSYIMFSANEDAVDAYLLQDGVELLDNNFKNLPYTCALNFHAQKDKEVAFTLDKVPSNIRVSLIDLENDSTETVLNLNEPVNISVNEGENEGRYLLKFGAMSSALNPIASAENTIEIYNNEDHIFISGKDLKSVEIVNTLGQTMQTEKISGEKAELYTKVPNGAYLVKAYNVKGESKVQKVVINR